MVRAVYDRFAYALREREGGRVEVQQQRVRCTSGHTGRTRAAGRRRLVIYVYIGVLECG